MIVNYAYLLHSVFCKHVQCNQHQNYIIHIVCVYICTYAENKLRSHKYVCMVSSIQRSNKQQAMSNEQQETSALITERSKNQRTNNRKNKNTQQSIIPINGIRNCFKNLAKSYQPIDKSFKKLLILKHIYIFFGWSTAINDDIVYH